MLTRSFLGTCMAALIALCVTNQPALAHHGCGGPHFGFGISFAPAPYYYSPPYYAYPAYPYPAYGYGYPYSSYPYYYRAPAPAPAPAYPVSQSAPSAATSQQTASTSSPPPPPQAAGLESGRQASRTLDIRMPDAQGEVWVDGQKVGGAGTHRAYQEMAATNDHIHKVTAAWHESGRLVTQERLVDLTNSPSALIDFGRSQSQTAAKVGADAQPSLSR